MIHVYGKQESLEQRQAEESENPASQANLPILSSTNKEKCESLN